MMQTCWQFMKKRTTLQALAWCVFGGLLVMAAILLELPMAYAAGALCIALAAAILVWLWRRRRDRRASGAPGRILERQAHDAPHKDGAARRQEYDVNKKHMLAAIGTLKGSKLGQLGSDAALYKLPWYLVIGNPAAGKSTAIANSGLQFPYSENNIIEGVSGTRHCDWFLATDGILLDTAGRYSVAAEDRAEWFDFLGLLKKYRKKAPVNGIVIAVSVAELNGSGPEFTVELAKDLRMRVQEITERLEVHAPVYLLFTKADLVPGFGDFFRDTGDGERERVWGATFPYNRKASSQQVLEQFDARFDELADGLRDLSRTNMVLQAGTRIPAGVFTFPLEFGACKPALRSFVATLFEENPYQFKPVFRGFYFSSALQEGAPTSDLAQRIAGRFDIALQASPAEAGGQRHGYFLLNLFRKVIFADKDLVAQYATKSQRRMRYAAFFAVAALIGLALGGWSWSYLGNERLIASARLSLDLAIKAQAARSDLQSRLEALGILQDRLDQLQAYRKARPLSLGLGLYQGDALERKLRAEYFHGVSEILLQPVGRALEDVLGQLDHGADGKPPANAEDAYNALKTYLILGDRERARTDAGHLNDQLSRYWRGWLDANRGAMAKERLIREAERIISFYIAAHADPAWPTIDTRLELVETARRSLNKVMRGMPARERVYAEIRARANTRFKPMTVAAIVGEQDRALVLGSHAIAGGFTREAWQDYMQPELHKAASNAVKSRDWVLDTSLAFDLPMEGSPDQIERALVEMYKNDYAKEWQKFIQGVTIRELDSFDAAVIAMTRLGDPHTSPLDRLLARIYEETAWDNPALAGPGTAAAAGGLSGWFKKLFKRQAEVPMPVPQQAAPPGPVGREFSGVARLVVARDHGASLMRSYMDHLSKLRARFNQIKNQDDPGPGAKLLMQQTLDGNGSELDAALKFVDEQMLAGMTESQKLTIRPVLVRPLMQGYAVIVKPSEAEIDKVWAAQVVRPFQQELAPKFPFSSDANSEAGDEEIGQVFGPAGAIAKFFDTTIGPLVVRRGTALDARTWGGAGIALAPSVVANYPAWIAPLGAQGAVAAGGAETQTLFDLQAQGITGGTEFTIDLDGQSLRWKGQPQPYLHMAWPSNQGPAGARITAIAPDGRTVVVLDAPGNAGFRSLVDAARRKRRDDGSFELSWSGGGVVVSANLKLLGARPAAAARPGKRFAALRLPESIIAHMPQEATALIAGAAQ